MMMRVQVAVLLLVGLGPLCEAQKLRESPATNDNVSRFVPPNAILVMQLAVHFGDSTPSEMVLAYAAESTPTITTGVRVIKNGSIIFEDSGGVVNGAGASDAIRIEKVKGGNGSEGVLVALKNSGAGTATDWHVLAMVSGKISRLNPGRTRTKILEQRGYQDWGYNGVTANGEYIIETQPGYSRETARCCPDRPTIKMIFEFNGTSMRLDRVAELPFTRTYP